MLIKTRTLATRSWAKRLVHHARPMSSRRYDRRVLFLEPLERRLVLSTVFTDFEATGLNDGTSWTNAYTDLQDSLGSANSGDDIWVAEGVYKPTSGTSRYVSFKLKTGVDVYGGFAGTESALGERDWSSNVTTLYGDLKDDDDSPGGDNSDNSYHVVDAYNVKWAALDGFTITAGNANGTSWPDATGGGMITNEYSKLNLNNLIFRGNSAMTSGGGLHNHYFSSPQLTNVVFSGNSAGQFGGGLHNSTYSSPKLTNVTFSDNSAMSFGGGLSNYSHASPTLINCVLWGNTAPTEPQISLRQSSSIAVSHSIVEGGAPWSGTGNLNADPLFVDAANGDLRLLPGSPAIDAGTATGAPLFDLDNHDRPIDGDGDGIAEFDMGAYEYEVSGVISGRKFEDLDADGVHDTNEPGLNDWTIELVDRTTGAVVAIQTTASIDLNNDGNIDPVTEQGLYSFAGLTAGDYQVREVPQDDWRQTFPDNFGFGAATSYATGVQSEWSDAADFDGDGDIDLVVANRGGTVSVFSNDGTGAFGSATNYSVGGTSHAVVVGDVDLDGDVDIVTVNEGSSNVSVLFNNGSGVFGGRVDYAAGFNPYLIGLGDLDGDGDLDIVSGIAGRNKMTVLINQRVEDGSFSFVTGGSFTVGVDPRFGTLADVDNDNDLDAIVAGDGSQSIAVLINNGSASFSTPTVYGVGSGCHPVYVAAGDLDGDGDIDLAVPNQGPGLRLLSNDGSGNFSDEGALLPTANFSFTTIADLDGDGDQDLIMPVAGTTTVRIGLNQGAFSFDTSNVLNLSYATPSLTVAADLDGDGDYDLAIPHQISSGRVSVVLNQTGTHLITLASGQVLEDIDFGNKSTLVNPPTSFLQIIDDGDAVGYSDSANMSVWSQGFQNDVREAAVGGTAQSAFYTFTDLPPGTYRISSTWTPYTNRASNAPYVINGGTAIPINQKLSPGDPSFTSIVDSGATFADLDRSFSLPAGGAIMVGLSDSNANGNVIIDAVRVELLTTLDPNEPEIQVSDGVVNVLVGDNVDFGATNQLAPISRDITIQNAGGADLTLGAASSSSADFTVTGGNTTVAPGASTTITVLMTAQSTGSVSSTISLVNDDSDEAPFTFTVGGQVNLFTHQIIDDGDAVGYSDSANMSVWAQGFQNDVREATVGGAAQSAFYTFTDLAPGIYRVSTTWTPYSNRASNASYVINGGTAIPINQKLSPSDPSFTSVVDSGATFADLDSSFDLPIGGAIVVGLSDSNASGNVIIDAVRVELLTTLDPNEPEIQVSDGVVNVLVGDNIDLGATNQLAPVSRDITIQNAGGADLTLGAASSSSADFTVIGGNATVAPGASTTITVLMTAQSTGSVSSTILLVNDDSDESPFTFTVGGQVNLFTHQIIDDGDAVGYSDSANMSVWAQGFQNDVREATVGGAAQSAFYTFTDLAPGIYRVSTTWTPYSNRASNAPYVINGGTAIPINQKLSPSDPSFTSVVDSGATFADLDSSFNLSIGGAIMVGLSDSNANGNVIIDAVRVELLAPLRAEQGLAIGMPDAATLNFAEVAPLLVQAVNYWETVDPGASSSLQNVQVIVKDLPSSILGLASFTTPTIWLDENGAGYGWRRAGDPSLSHDSPLITGMDLATVIAHELGHVLGLPDLDATAQPHSIMTADLENAIRRLPAEGRLDSVASLLFTPTGSDDFRDRDEIFASFNKPNATSLFDYGVTGLTSNPLAVGSEESRVAHLGDRRLQLTKRHSDADHAEIVDDLFADLDLLALEMNDQSDLVER